jgi:hypothetical protein
MKATLFRRLLLLQYPQFMQPLNLMRVFCVFLALGNRESMLEERYQRALPCDLTSLVITTL